MISDDSGSESSEGTRSGRARRLRRALSRTSGALPRRTVVSEPAAAAAAPPPLGPRHSAIVGPARCPQRPRRPTGGAPRLQPVPASPPFQPLRP